jgi:hypothetical protein
MPPNSRVSFDSTEQNNYHDKLTQTPSPYLHVTKIPRVIQSFIKMLNLPLNSRNTSYPLYVNLHQDTAAVNQKKINTITGRVKCMTLQP